MSSTLKQEYIIEEAYITADRLGDAEIEITRFITELNLFEDIEKPYITGSIAVMDDRGLFDEIGFRGTEKLTITVTAGNQEMIARGMSYTHTYCMTSMVERIRSNDKVEVFVFSLLDEHAFFDSTKKISKSYTGKPEDIVSRICAAELDLSIDKSYLSPSAQKPFKVVVPYLSPLQASKWIMNRATTDNGSPFFIYSSLYDQTEEGNAVRIGNLDVMLQQDPFNLIPFKYSAAATNLTVEQSEDARAFIVKDLVVKNAENTLEMVDRGAISSSVTSRDLFSNVKLSTTHKIRKTLDRLQRSEIIRSDSEQTVFDEEQVLVENAGNTVFLDDAPSRVVNMLTSYGTYGNAYGFHDATTRAEVVNKVRRSSLHTLLYRNAFEISLPGIAFFAGLRDGNKGISVGDILRLDFLTSNVNIGSNSDAADLLDKEKSGNYIILRIRNIYQGTEHNVSVYVSKMSDLPKGDLV